MNDQEKYPLLLHHAWDKGISHQDRALFAKLNRKHPPTVDQITLVPVRTGFTHEGNLLATVIIQNGTDEPLTFDGTNVEYILNGRTEASHTFTILDLFVQPKSSTPWTFLFPPESQEPTIREVGREKISRDQYWSVVLHDPF